MGDMIDGLYDQAEALLIATVFILVLVSVVQVYLKSRSWVPTLGALLVGAVALWGVNSIEALGRSVDRTIDEAAGGGRADRGRFTTSGLDSATDAASPRDCGVVHRESYTSSSGDSIVMTVYMCSPGIDIADAFMSGCRRIDMNSETPAVFVRCDARSS